MSTPEPVLVLVDTAAAAAAVGRPVGTIRRWGSTRLLERHGRDTKGRALWDLEQVYRVAGGLA